MRDQPVLDYLHELWERTTPQLVALGLTDAQAEAVLVILTMEIAAMRPDVAEAMTLAAVRDLFVEAGLGEVAP